MNLRTGVSRFISSPIIAIITFALLLQLADGYIRYRLSKKENHLQIQSRILALQSAFKKLESKGELNTTASIPVARTMKALKDHRDYSSISPEWKTELESKIDKLPEPVKNLVFSSLICLKNTLFDEFLYAAEVRDGGYGHNYERRSVFTGVPDQRAELSPFKWRVQFTDEYTFELYNKKFDEMLFGDHHNRFYQDKERRLVYTYREFNPYLGFGVGSILAWNPEVDGETLELKNDQTKEFLFADADRKQSHNRRYVFTYTPGGRMLGSKWKIIDCFNSEKIS